MTKTDHVELWKKSRDSAEHFDSLVADIRKVTLTINAALVPISIHLVEQFNEWESYLKFIGVSLCIFSFVMWVLDKHYHLYLLASAQTASNIEDSMDIPETCKLTHMLSMTKQGLQHEFFVIRYYDILYFISIFAGYVLLYISKCHLLSLIIAFVAEFVLVLTVHQRHNQAEDDLRKTARPSTK